MINALILSALLFCNPILNENTSIDQEISELLSNELPAGEALIWHLDHSGWAIKTKTCLLIFDYWERRKRPENSSLEYGFINPEEIKNLKVVVFSSHSHSDHFDPVILEWEKTVSDITYVFGWQAGNKPGHIYCKPEREKFEIGGIKVYTVVHEFDNIPESAFLVEVDGVTIYHAGDHSGSKGAANEVFKSNIEYLVSLNKSVDFAFTPTWGGEDYMIESLKPRFTFPMHNASSFRQYAKFALKSKSKQLPTVVIAAEKHGHLFQYKENKVSSKNK